MFNFKKLTSIFSREDSELGTGINDLPSVEAVDTWIVRWTSRFGEYASDTRPEVEVFVNKHDAEAFKKSLEAAFELLRHTSDVHVYLEKMVNLCKNT